MQVLIKNYELAWVIEASRNVRAQSGPMRGATLMKLAEAEAALTGPYRTFSGVIPVLEKNYLKHSDGTPVTPLDSTPLDRLVCTDDQARKDLAEALGRENPVELAPLDNDDIAQLTLDDEQWQALKLIHQDYARRPKPKIDKEEN